MIKCDVCWGDNCGSACGEELAKAKAKLETVREALTAIKDGKFEVPGYENDPRWGSVLLLNKTQEYATKVIAEVWQEGK